MLIHHQNKYLQVQYEKQKAQYDNFKCNSQFYLVLVEKGGVQPPNVFSKCCATATHNLSWFIPATTYKISNNDYLTSCLDSEPTNIELSFISLILVNIILILISVHYLG